MVQRQPGRARSEHRLFISMQAAAGINDTGTAVTAATGCETNVMGDRGKEVKIGRFDSDSIARQRRVDLPTQRGLSARRRVQATSPG